MQRCSLTFRVASPFIYGINSRRAKYPNGPSIKVSVTSRRRGEEQRKNTGTEENEKTGETQPRQRGRLCNFTREDARGLYVHLRVFYEAWVRRASRLSITRYFEQLCSPLCVENSKRRYKTLSRVHRAGRKFATESRERAVNVLDYTYTREYIMQL